MKSLGCSDPLLLETVFFFHENPGCKRDVQCYVSLAMGIDCKTSEVVQRVVEEL